jgi:predicted ABC-type sugar transport system permease subunit
MIIILYWIHVNVVSFLVVDFVVVTGGVDIVVAGIVTVTVVVDCCYYSVDPVES